MVIARLIFDACLKFVLNSEVSFVMIMSSVVEAWLQSVWKLNSKRKDVIARWDYAILKAAANEGHMQYLVLLLLSMRVFSPLFLEFYFLHSYEFNHKLA
jgi:hypothetical protein